MTDVLLDRIAAFHSSRSTVPEFPMVAEVLDVLDAVRSPDEIPPTPPLSFTRHLAAVGPSGEAALDAVIEEFLRIAHDLPWRQTAGYLDILSDEYLANYGYVRLVGPAPSIIDHPLVRVGIGVWGSHLEYPLHEYEAEELNRSSPVRRRWAPRTETGPTRSRATPCTTRRGTAMRSVSEPSRPSCRACRALIGTVGKSRR